jgi:hypothetical protein
VLSAADVARLASDATHRSIIIFKNQLAGLPARGATVNARIKAANTAQSGVMGELRQVHAGHMTSFHVIDAIAPDQVVDGSGVKVGIIADGIDPDNPDLIRFTVAGDELVNIPYAYTVG